MSKENFTLEEIKEMLIGIANKSPPFWGETTLLWQDGKTILWREVTTRKPMKGGKAPENII